MEAARLALVRDPDVLAVAAFGSHPAGLEPRLESECAPRPPLAGETVADGDADRLPVRPETELLATAGGLPRHSALVRDRGAVPKKIPGPTGWNRCAPVRVETTERPNWFPAVLP